MKLILAIISKEDELETIAELNKRNFFVTKLSTTGGFFKKKNTTIMVGTEEEGVDSAITIIKKFAGLRKTISYSAPTMMEGGFSSGANMAIQTDVEVGGSTIFVMNIERFEKM